MNNKQSEVTEKLVGNGAKKKGFSKKTIIIFVGIVLILLVLAGGVGGYYYYNNSQYTKNLELAQKYLNDGDYENAVLAYEEAIKISDRNTEAYQGLAEAALLNGDPDKAQEAYNKIFDLTNDPNYKYLAQQTQRGNTVGNYFNNGLLTQQGEDEFLLVPILKESGSGLAQIWKMGKDSPHIISTFEILDNQALNQSGLSAWGNNIFRSDNYRGMVPMNSRTGQDETITNVPSGKTENYKIYKNKMFYFQISTVNTATKDLYMADLDGSNPRKLTDRTGTYLKYWITNDTAYVVEASLFMGDYLGIYKIPLDSGVNTRIYNEMNTFIYSGCQNGTKFYFNTFTGLDAPEEERNAIDNFSSELGVLNIDTDKVETIDLGKPIVALNCNDDYLYYVSGDTLYRSDFSGENEEVMGSGIEFPPGGGAYSSYHRCTINLSSTQAIITSSTSNNVLNNFGSTINYYSVPLDQPGELKKLDLVMYKNGGVNGYDKGVTEELKQAYRLKVTELYNSTSRSAGSSMSDYSCRYSLFDMNNDSVPELIVQTGTSEATYMFNVFTYRDGSVVSLGDFGGGHSLLTGETNEYAGQLIRYYAQMDHYEYTKIILKDDKITEEQILSDTAKGGEYPEVPYYAVPWLYGNDLSLLN